MLASYEFIKDSRVFPFDNLIGMLDWKHVAYSTTLKQISKLTEEGHKLVPLFLINKKYYVPKQFNKTCKAAYPGMKETSLELFQRIKGINYTTIPIMTEIINNYEYGLIPWINNSSVITDNINIKDIQQMLECGNELSEQNVFHLDLNKGNIIKAERIYFIDPSLATNHFRPKHNYFNERAITYHWSPEILNGGKITEKSSIYSLGKTINFCSNKLERKIDNLVNYFIEEDPNNRPSFSEAYKRIKEIR